MVKAKDTNKKGSMRDQVIATIKKISKEEQEKKDEEKLPKQFISSVEATG